MSGLFGTLSTTARALEAQRAGLTLTAHNMANLNTEGFSRRTLLLAEARIGGVEVLGIRARRDALIEARVGREIPAEARQGARAEILGVVEAALGRAGASLDARLSAFFDSASALATDPTSVAARDGLLQQGRLLARTFNDLSARFVSSRLDADLQVRADAQEINRLAARVAALNESIAAAIGGDAEGLRDERNLALQQLAALADVNVLTRADGAVDVSIASGRALVVGATAYVIDVTNQPVTGYAALSIGGFDITTAIVGGRLAGAIEMRDVTIPGYQARLDELAYGVAQQVNAVHQAGYDLDGNTGQAFFTPPAGVAGAASALAVDPVLAASPRRVAASQTGAPGDNQAARALAALREARVMGGGQATFAEAWGQIVYQVGVDLQTAEAEQQSRAAVVDQLTALRDQVSGVSLDEEAANMLKYQRAYEANARLFSAVNSVLDTLMNLVGAA